MAKAEKLNVGSAWLVVGWNPGAKGLGFIPSCFGIFETESRARAEIRWKLLRDPDYAGWVWKVEET